MSSLGPSISIAVLVVEDEAFLRMDAVDLIEEAGFTVYEAANADEALALLKRHDDIRIVFTDVDMPGSMNGLQLVDRVHSARPGVKFVVTSGHHDLADSGVPHEGAFVPKPYAASRVTGLLTDMASLAA